MIISFTADVGSYLVGFDEIFPPEHKDNMSSSNKIMSFNSRLTNLSFFNTIKITNMKFVRLLPNNLKDLQKLCEEKSLKFKGKTNGLWKGYACYGSFCC
jgi:hypothetical protein